MHVQQSPTPPASSGREDQILRRYLALSERGIVVALVYLRLLNEGNPHWCVPRPFGGPNLIPLVWLVAHIAHHTSLTATLFLISGSSSTKGPTVQPNHTVTYTAHQCHLFHPDSGVITFPGERRDALLLASAQGKREAKRSRRLPDPKAQSACRCCTVQHDYSRKGKTRFVSPLLPIAKNFFRPFYSGPTYPSPPHIVRPTQPYVPLELIILHHSCS